MVKQITNTEWRRDSDDDEEESTMAPQGEFIHAAALLDMISENDTVSVATANMKTTSLGPASGTSNQEKKISIAEAFENW